MRERWHGTPNGYGYHKCRCSACREAHRLYRAQWRAENPEKAAAEIHRSTRKRSIRRDRRPHSADWMEARMAYVRLLRAEGVI